MKVMRLICLGLIGFAGCFDGSGTGGVGPAVARPDARRVNDGPAAQAPTPPDEPDAGGPVPPVPPAPDAAGADAGTSSVATVPVDAAALPPDAAGETASPPPSSTPVGPCGNDPSLALCVRFEGTFADESPARLPVQGSPLRYVPARAGLAAEMSGQRRLVVPDHPSLDATSITIEASVRPDEIDGGSMTVLEYPGQYGMVILGSGSLMCSAGAAGYALKPAALQAGRWYDLACVYRDGVISVFLDGALVAEKVAAPVPTAPTSGIRIGWDDMPNRQFVGLVDELRVWRAARPPRPR